MDRRGFLTTASGLVVGLATPTTLLSQVIEKNGNIHAGWVPNNEATLQFKSEATQPFFTQQANAISGSGEGKQAFLWKFYEKVSGNDLVPHDQTVGDCFIAGTIVLGEHIKPIEEIQIGDKVWTAEGKSATVISTRSILKQSPCIRIHTTGCRQITCTPDHRFFVCRLSKVNNKRVTKQRYERCSTQGGYNTAVVDDVYENRKYQWVSAEDLKPDDYLLTPKSIECMGRNDSLPAEGDFLWGYFLGDGHASGGSVELTLNKSHTNLKLKLESLIKKLGYVPKTTYYKDRNAIRIRIHSRELVRQLRKIFYSNKLKCFPGWAVGNKVFLEGLKTADGWSKDNINAIDNTSLSVVEGTALSLIKMGLEPSIGNVARSKGCYANAKPLYRVTWRENKQKHYTWSDDKFFFRPIKQIEYIEGESTVYDIGVDDKHHSFLANGIAVHNCVSQAWALGIDILDAVQISRGHGDWRGKIASEIIYAGGRVEIGAGKILGDGMHGSWAARWCRDYGVLLRKPYLSGEYDFSRYSGSKARKWAHFCTDCTKWGGGVPDELEPLCKRHPVRTVTLIKSWEEARDALYNGYPVAVCSDQGFKKTKRDKDGFAEPKYGPLRKWYHSMLLAGYDDTGKRPGGLLINSWGPNWIDGPTRFEQPTGSFWVDAKVIDSMLKYEDSFALSNYIGYPRQHLDYKLY